MAYSLNPLLKLLFQKDTAVSDLPGVNVTPDEINTLEGINTDTTIQQQINQLQNYADVSVKNWSEFLAAVESSQETPCRIHFTDNITVGASATLNLSNCAIYGHYHRWIVDGNMVTLTGNFAYFYDVLFQGAANSSTSTIAFSFVGNASTSCNFAFENCRFYNFLETASNNVFVRVDGASGSSIHTFLIRCVINGESNQTSSRALALRKYSGAAVSLKVTELLYSGKPIETRKLSMVNASGSQDMFVADGSCDYVGTRPTNFFQWGNLNPASFATAAQGEKADTALQEITQGTDGDYITTTVGAKDSNNAQSVGVEAKVQDISTADNDHKGILEAFNTKQYVDTQIYNISNNFQFYGVQWDTSNPSPECTRIGNMSLHAELPIQNAIVGGLLQDDLTFTPFADQTDWSGETLDGSAGQVMLQIPQHYVKFETHDTINKVLMSEYALPGFTLVPRIYVSAFKATVDRIDPTTPKLCSAVNTTAAFRGGNNNADWDNTYRSLLGFPATNVSLTDFRTYARNRAAGTAWNCHTYIAQKILYWLFVTEYATLNSQKAYNAAKDANGYAQGGLGPGASDWNWDSWNNFNNHNPLIPCGYLTEYGNQTAVKNYNVLDDNGNTLHTFAVNSYRGIQSPFGDIWDWTDGVLIDVQSDAAGGISTCYITDSPAKFSSTDFSQYTELGNTPRTDNYIKNIFFGTNGDIICKSQPGSSSTYYCDQYWGANLPSSGAVLRGFHFGGAASHGAPCGFLSAISHYVPAHVYPILGSRLCVLPSP